MESENKQSSDLSNLGEYWVRIKNSEHALLVLANEEDFEKKGLRKFIRVNQDGSNSSIWINMEMIDSINENN